MSVSLNGFNEMVVTFMHEGVKKGDLVKMSNENTVSACENGNEFCGICVNAELETAGIQLMGYAETNYSGSTPELGYQYLVADGAGGVKKASNGRKVLVVSRSDSTIGFIM